MTIPTDFPGATTYYAVRYLRARGIWAVSRTPSDGMQMSLTTPHTAGVSVQNATFDPVLMIDGPLVCGERWAATIVTQESARALADLEKD